MNPHHDEDDKNDKDDKSVDESLTKRIRLQTATNRTATTTNIRSFFLAKPSFSSSAPPPRDIPSTLSPQQRLVFEKYLAGENVFVTGPGGTGKSFLLKSIVADAKLAGLNTQVCGLTGRSAVLLECRARTIHSWSGIQRCAGPREKIVKRALEKLDANIKYFTRSTKQAAVAGGDTVQPLVHWRNVDLLIIDEVSMMSRKMLEVLDEIARRARSWRNREDRPMGGIQILFFGDFYQLAPVGKNDVFVLNGPTPPSDKESETMSDVASTDEQQAASVAAAQLDETATQYCFESAVWDRLFSARENHVQLDVVFRQQKDPVFVKILNQTRQGRLSKKSDAILRQRLCTIPPLLLPSDHTTSTTDSGGCPQYIPRLFALNAKANMLNQEIFVTLPPPVYEFTWKPLKNMSHYVDDNTEIPLAIRLDGSRLPSWIVDHELQSVLESSPCAQTLSLKIGTQVMLCFNLDLENGLCNGSLGTVIGFAGGPAGIVGGDPIVRFPMKTAATDPSVPSYQDRTISAQTYQSSNYPTLGFSQIPLKLAWGMTIHSSQGATLDSAYIDIGSDVFGIGQTYVALSRVRSLDGLFLTSYDPSKIKVSRKVVDFYRSKFE
jgi:ATP-dependent DNA helicase PIF1